MSMMRGLAFAALVCAFVLPGMAHAGKVDDVKKAIKDKCSKDLSESETMDAVVKAYDCSPDTDVVVASCTIKCLKASGAVVGGK